MFEELCNSGHSDRHPLTRRQFAKIAAAAVATTGIGAAALTGVLATRGDDNAVAVGIERRCKRNGGSGGSGGRKKCKRGNGSGGSGSGGSGGSGSGV